MIRFAVVDIKKTAILFTFLLFLLATSIIGMAQTADVPMRAGATKNRVSFLLKNTLGYHRMFRVEGPGIAYGFTMGKRETTPCHWPVGSKLYFTQDGETTTGLILTVTAADEGKTLLTNTGATETVTTPPAAIAASPQPVTINIRLRNASLRSRRVALISYEPGATGNGTTIFTLLPLASSTFKFPVGTKLYTANDQQVSVVMSGRRIDEEKPFLIVQKEDAGRVINLD